MREARAMDIRPPQTLVHDMSSPFGFLRNLRARGLDSYPSRAAVFSQGVVVTGADSGMCALDIQANHQSLQRMGIGAKELVVVPGTNLQQGLLRNPELLRHVRHAIFERGRPLSLYLARGMEPLLAALGVRWQETDAAVWEVASLFDDKHTCRLLGRELGVTPCFPAWQFIQGECSLDSLEQARAEVLCTANWRGLPTTVVALKRQDYDGGEGIFFWEKTTSASELLAYCEEHGAHGFLMEAGYPRHLFRTYEVSLQVLIGELGWRVDYPTLQLTRDRVHMGNVLAVGEPLLESRVLERIQTMVAPFCREAVRTGFGCGRSRNMGFDFLVVEHNGETQVFLLEINARNTAPCYAKAVLDQAAPRFQGHCTVAMVNRQVSAGQTHFSLERQLDGLIWDGTKRPGVIIGNPASISHGKVTLFVVGQNHRIVHEWCKELPAL